MSRWRLLAVFSAMVLTLAACTGGGGGGTAPGGGDGDAGSLPTSIGPGEGELNLIAWPGYTQKGWVEPFEKETGCKVKVKYGNTSDEMVNLMRQGGGSVYDGVSASGDATNRLIAAGDVAPLNIDLIPDYKDAMPTLQSPPHNTVDGVHYGVPYMWGPNVLMWNSSLVDPAPTSWDIVFEADSNYGGQVTAYDSPIYIADAALYLKTHQPDLGIEDPYELTSEQLDAAVALLQQQKELVFKYWAIYTDEIQGFKAGDMAVGTAWPVNQQLLLDKGVKVEVTVPEEGVTGWADSWMMSANAEHPNCTYMWMDYTMRPDVQAQVAAYYYATPSNTQSCDIMRKTFGESTESVFHCGDDEFLSQIALWKTPLADCGNGKTDCMDYTTWTEKWTEIRGA